MNNASPAGVYELFSVLDEIQDEIFSLVGNTVPAPKYRVSRTVKKRVRMRQLIAAAKLAQQQLEQAYANAGHR